MKKWIMKYMKNFLTCLAFLISSQAAVARGNKIEDMLALVKLSTATTTQTEFIASLGQPGKIEEKGRHTWWYYDQGANNVSLCWNKGDQLERLDFKSGSDEKDTFDMKVPAKLQTGKTDLLQAVKLLGTPKTMMIKENRQEIHYVYNNSILRLFFRDRILIDYALIGQSGMQ
jgi:hypothetical protein